MASVFHSFARHKELAACRGTVANLSQPGLRYAICNGLSHLSWQQRDWTCLCLLPGVWMYICQRRCEQEKSNCLQLLYKKAVMYFTWSWCIMVALFALSSFANTALPLLFWSRALLLLSWLFAFLYPSVPFFSWDYLSPASPVPISVFLIHSYCSTTGISLSH